MSKTLNINGVRYESSASIAGRFNYTQDYVSRLAREKKIEATRIGRLWFVDASSFEHFVEVSEETKKIRAEDLRIQRQQERTMSTDAGKVRQKKEKSSRVAAAHTALAQAILVVACGLFAGSLGWLIHNQEITVTQLQEGSMAMVTQMQRAVVFDVLASYPASSFVPKERKVQQRYDTFAVFPESEYVSTEIVSAQKRHQEVEGYFSDEVLMYFTKDGQEAVRPVFVDAELGEEFLLSVQPLSTNTQ